MLLFRDLMHGLVLGGIRHAHAIRGAACCSRERRLLFRCTAAVRRCKPDEFAVAAGKNSRDALITEA